MIIMEGKGIEILANNEHLRWNMKHQRTLKYIENQENR